MSDRPRRVGMAALLEEREQGGGRAVSALKGLAEGDCGAGAVGEDAPFWSLLSSGLSREEGRVEDCPGWFSFWVE